MGNIRTSNVFRREAAAGPPSREAKQSVHSATCGFRFLLLLLLLVVGVRFPISAERADQPARVDPEKYLGLSEQECVNKLRETGLAWSDTKDNDGARNGFRKFILSSSGFDILCTAGHVVEINLYGPDGEKMGFQGVMHGTLSWDDVLSDIRKKMGPPQYEEDVANHDTYYVGYESKGRRVILSLTRKAPRKLQGVRIQSVPVQEEQGQPSK